MMHNKFIIKSWKVLLLLPFLFSCKINNEIKNQAIKYKKYQSIKFSNPIFQGDFSLTIETEGTTTGMSYIKYIFNIKSDIATLNTITYHEPMTCNGSYKVVENNKILELYYSGNEDNCKSKEPNFKIKKEGRDYFIKGVGGEGTFNECIKIIKMY